jgi:hypothetical protein
MGRKYETESGLRSNIYIVGIGATGCGKNHARSVIKRILAQADAEELLGGEEVASGPAILCRVGKTPNVLFQLDEFGLLMQQIQNPNSGAHAGSILAVLMKMFSSAGDIYVGTEYADQRKRERETIKYPCVNVHATTTGESFYSALDSKHVLTGYLNRLLVLESQDDRPERQRTRGGKMIPLDILDWIAAAANPTGGGNLTGINPAAPLAVMKTERAAKLFDDYDDRITRELEAVRGTGLDALWSRAWEHADKLALVGAVAENPTEPRVTTEIAEWALAVVNYSVGQLVASVRDKVADSPFEARKKECLREIWAAGERGLTARDMGRVSAFRKLTPTELAEVQLALNNECTAHLVTLKTAGRDRLAWVAADFLGAGEDE